MPSLPSLNVFNPSILSMLSISQRSPAISALRLALSPALRFLPSSLPSRTDGLRAGEGTPRRQLSADDGGRRAAGAAAAKRGRRGDAAALAAAGERGKEEERPRGRACEGVGEEGRGEEGREEGRGEDRRGEAEMRRGHAWYPQPQGPSSGPRAPRSPLPRLVPAATLGPPGLLLALARAAVAAGGNLSRSAPRRHRSATLRRAQGARLHALAAARRHPRAEDNKGPPVSASTARWQ